MIEKLKKLLNFIDEINIEEYNQEIEEELNSRLSIIEEIREKEYSIQYTKLAQKPQVHSFPANYQSMVDKGSWDEYRLNQFVQNVKSSLFSIRKLVNTLVQLEPFGKENRNIVLVGANGAGKSSFANYLAQHNLFENLAVIPAQKLLFFDIYSGSNTATPDVIQQQQSNVTLKNYGINDLKGIFTNLVVAAVNQESQINFEYKGKENAPKTEFENFKNIFTNLFSDIDFTMDIANRVIIPIKDSQKYYLDAMSDGEKVAVYYILRILFARQNSYIIVDEPETYLNSNISSKLWNMLEQQRADCQFIYITHNIEFINSRVDSDLFWMKSGNINKESWRLEKIEQLDIPQDLLISLLGSRKNILFCEGNGRSSIDYRIYETLFGDKYTVYPVNGCEKVKQYTKAYNSPNDTIFKNKAIGIIDYDLRSEDEINNLAQNNIFVNAEVNEIEMVLLLPEILQKFVNQYFPDSDKAEEFKNAMIEIARENSETIILNKTKSSLEERVSNEKIQKNKNKAQLKEDFLKLFTEEIFDTCYSAIESEVIKAIESGDYMSSLKINCLKKSYISVANKIFKDEIHRGINYESASQKLLMDDKELSELVKTKYYSMIP